MSDLRQYIVEVPDFPKPGILFRDITGLLRDHFARAVQALDELFDASVWADVDAVAGIESRGFILAAALANRHEKGFVPVRKKGKLPPPVFDVAYDLEYGTGVLEMQPGNGSVLVIDDVLATGGTLRAAAELAKIAGYEIAGLGVLIDLGFAPGLTWGAHTARSVICYG
jgi:adenine phosphoribosyltransferase